MLKKFLGASLVSLALAGSVYAEERSGFFAGIHGGVVFLQQQATVNSTVFADTTDYTLNGGVNFGYQYFFVSYVGARAYASYDFNGLIGGNSNSIHDMAGNIDLLFNLINGSAVSVGLFAGIGFGYSIITGSGSSEGYNGFIMPINVGVSLTLAERHRVEVGGKLPLAFYANYVADSLRINFRPWVVNVGYTFIF